MYTVNTASPYNSSTRAQLARYWYTIIFILSSGFGQLLALIFAVVGGSTLVSLAILYSLVMIIC